ncbi:MAG: phasin family protein [Desulfobacterales bacterium]|jgi:polyhydroxyalkanoate synthesis regulator phasin
MADFMELFKKTIITGVGLALTAKDEVDEWAKEVEKRLNLTEEEGRKFFNDVQKRYEDSQAKLEARVEQTVKDILKKADIVTADELKAVKKEIWELKQTLSDQTGSDDD